MPPEGGDTVRKAAVLHEHADPPQTRNAMPDRPRRDTRPAKPIRERTGDHDRRGGIIEKGGKEPKNPPPPPTPVDKAPSNKDKG